LSLVTDVNVLHAKQQDEGKKIAIQATGAVSWRRPDIKYRKNEAFVDIVESVNLLLSSEGIVIRTFPLKSLRLGANLKT
jgi:AP-2 complex subunit mu-1